MDELCGDSRVFLAGFLHDPGVDELLQFFVGPQAQHFLSAAGGVLGAKIGINDREERLKLVGGFLGEDVGELFSDAIWTPT